tara:strand:+ start:1014 stop:1262 length:249 start_codon:yes stop_codon:yes gene_type:complete
MTSSRKKNPQRMEMEKMGTKMGTKMGKGEEEMMPRRVREKSPLVHLREMVTVGVSWTVFPVLGKKLLPMKVEVLESLGRKPD